MLEFPSSAASSTLIAAVYWTTFVAAATTLALFAHTLALRFATMAAARRRLEVKARWREIFADAMLSATQARGRSLPRYARRECLDLLEEWNHARESVEGEAAGNLIVLGERLGFNEIAASMLGTHRLSNRLLALQTLGHLHDRSEWDDILALLDHPNTALSVTAARALVEIDPDEAVRFVMPQVIARIDWPPVSVSRILTCAGTNLVTQPLCNAILTSDAETAVRMLKYSGSARTETMDQCVEILLREREEPAVLASAMKVMNSGAGLRRIAALTEHGAWYVRMQAAKALGRLGLARDLPLLERLLSDREWWVRYRAAQAIVSLPLDPGALRALRDRQSDRFAADMMHQALAEAGIA
jgi:hypothetical protein